MTGSGDSAELLELLPLPRNTMNNSAAGAIMSCPHKYELQNVLGLKQRSSSPLVFGTAIHIAQNFANHEMLRGYERPGVDRIQAVFAEALPAEITKVQAKTGFELEWKEHEHKPQDTLDILKDDGVMMLDVFEREVGQHLRPAFAEFPFEIRFENTPWIFNGRMDLGTQDGVLADYKTSDKAKDDADIHTDVQMTDYQIAVKYGSAELKALMPEVRKLVKYILVRPTKDHPQGRVQVLECEPRSEETMTARLHNLATIVAQIRTGYFPTVDDWRTCGYFCGFLDRCKPEWYELKKRLREQKASDKKEKTEEKSDKPAKSKPAAGRGKGKKS